MLRVRIPPEPSHRSRPRGAAWSARHPVTVEVAGSNPVGDAGIRTARYANRQSGQAQTLVILWVRLPPVLLAAGLLGWCSSRRPVNPLPSSCEAEGEGSTPSPPTDGSRQARSSIGQDTSPSSWRGGFDSRTGHWTTRQVVELVDTRPSERSCPRGVGVRISPWRLHLLQAGRCPAGSHKADCPARYRGLGLAGGPVLGRVS